MSTQFTQEVQMVNQNMKKYITLPEMREMQAISYELSAHAYQTNQNTVAKLCVGRARKQAR